MSDSIARATTVCATQKTQGSTDEKAIGMTQQSWRLIALYSKVSGTWAETPGARMTMDEANTLAQQGIIKMRVQNIKGRTVCEVQEVA